MNSLVQFALNNNPEISMNSKEIADMIKSAHGDLFRSIKRLADRGIIQLPPMAKVEDKQSLSPNNKTKVFVFDYEHKLDSITVIAQNSPEFTAKLVARWDELERKVRTISEQIEEAMRFKTRIATAANYHMLVEAVTDVFSAENDPDAPDFDQMLLKRKWREANFLNKIFVGMTATVFRRHFDIPDFGNGIRDTFPTKLLEAYEIAQVLDATMLLDGASEESRRRSIQNMVAKRFPQVALFTRTILKEIELRKSGQLEKLTHPAKYHELRADKEVLEFLGAKEAILLSDRWEEVSSIRLIERQDPIFGGNND